MIKIDEVRPLIVATPPFPDESFQGFFARTLAKTAARSLNSGLALAKVQPRPRTKAAFFSQDELTSLAMLLCADLEWLTKVAFPDVSRKRHELQRVRSFFGIRVPFSMFDMDRRRVSPTGLSIASYHRAMWTLRLFHLDGETLEPLMSHCPVCNQPLGWKRSVHPAACDTCVNSLGRSNVDLRDFRHGPAELEDPEAYRYVYSLANPNDEAKIRASEEFANVSRAVRFEAIFTMIRWMLQTQVTRNRLAPTKDVPYWRASPKLVASAGRYFLNGRQGLSDFQRTFPGASPGRPFGVVVSLDRLVGAGTKLLFESALRPSRVQLEQSGIHSAQWLGKKYAMPRRAIERLADAEAPEWSRGKPVVVHDEKVRVLAPLYQDSLSYKRCSDVLGFTPPGISSLIALGVFRDVQEDLKFILPNRQFLSGASVSEALRKLDQKARLNDVHANMDFRRVTFRTPYPLFCALAAALDDEIDVCYTTSSFPCWADAYGPRSPSDFAIVLQRINLLLSRP